MFAELQNSVETVYCTHARLAFEEKQFDQLLFLPCNIPKVDPNVKAKQDIKQT